MEEIQYRLRSLWTYCLLGGNRICLKYMHIKQRQVCDAITEYQTPLNSPPSHYKELESNDESLLGTQWNGSSWEEVSE